MKLEIEKIFEYKFEKIKIKFSLSENKFSEDYHAVIRQHAANGWRLVQVFDPAIGAAGSATFIELIFEKKID